MKPYDIFLPQEDFIVKVFKGARRNISTQSHFQEIYLLKLEDVTKHITGNYVQSLWSNPKLEEFTHQEYN